MVRPGFSAREEEGRSPGRPVAPVSPTPGASRRRGAAFFRARGKERGAKDHRRRTARNGPVTREDSVRDTRPPGTEQVADELRRGKPRSGEGKANSCPKNQIRTGPGD